MKAAVLLSGGIDSPVSAYIVAKKLGKKLQEMIFINFQVSDDKGDKIGKLVRRIKELTGIRTKLYKIPYEMIQRMFIEKCMTCLTCILCKRFMFRIAEKIAKNENADLLVTGENLSQVASQTLDNMVVNTNAIKMRIIRPILCNDKEETIAIAKETGLFELSILPGIKCSAVPQNPATKSTVQQLEHEESKIDVNEIVSNALNAAVQIEY